jgi:hypothetical protein
MELFANNQQATGQITFLAQILPDFCGGALNIN